jgi:hypothetical protein
MPVFDTTPPPQLPISDPRYNIREVVKQMLLLEQHLLEESKYCPDCISKHILTIEALAEEGQNLDKSQEWSKTFTPLVGKSRVWAAAFTKGVPVKVIGQDVRQIRKSLAPDLLAPIQRHELDEVAEIEGEFGGFLRQDVGMSHWQTWAVVFTGMAAVMWWTENKYGPGSSR